MCEAGLTSRKWTLPHDVSLVITYVKTTTFNVENWEKKDYSTKIFFSNVADSDDFGSYCKKTSELSILRMYGTRLPYEQKNKENNPIYNI